MTADVGLAVPLYALRSQQLVHLAVNDLLDDLRGPDTALSLQAAANGHITTGRCCQAHDWP